jgi:hypothetical protein
VAALSAEVVMPAKARAWAAPATTDALDMDAGGVMPLRRLRVRRQTLAEVLKRGDRGPPRAAVIEQGIDILALLSVGRMFVSVAAESSTG